MTLSYDRLQRQSEGTRRFKSGICVCSADFQWDEKSTAARWVQIEDVWENKSWSVSCPVVSHLLLAPAPLVVERVDVLREPEVRAEHTLEQLLRRSRRLERRPRARARAVRQRRRLRLSADSARRRSRRRRRRRGRRREGRRRGGRWRRELSESGARDAVGGCRRGCRCRVT